jgi:peptidoglycan/LPS O-acetylase OafA/YrhL
MEYRREIDGLRALAVIPVILFHAGFEVFSGGYVGVDVFFVISGYLIASIVMTEMSAERFSLARFYERRARRILPALLLVVAVCIPAAYALLLPSEMKEFGQSLVATMTFSSNILFWSQTGYFEGAAEMKPLLHTWSLAVEEQFYLFFPLFMMLAWRWGRAWLTALLILVAIASLALAQWGALHKPIAAFFLLPTRAWELIIGVLVALHLSRPGQKEVPLAVRNGASLLGAGLLLFAIFGFDQRTPFPGLYALVPTVGTALIIVYCAPQTWVGKVLCSSAFVGVGLISYSAYLWHQPLFAFAKHAGLPSHHTALYGGLSLLALALAYGSWRFVETPIRHARHITRRQMAGFSFAGCSAVAVLGAVAHAADGFVDRLAPEDRYLATVSPGVYGEYVRKRFDDLHHVPFKVGDQRVKVLVVGDSFAKDLVNAVYESPLAAQIQISTHQITAGCGNLHLARDFRDDITQKQPFLCDNDGWYKGQAMHELIRQSDVVWIASAWSPWEARLLKESLSNLNQEYGEKFIVFGSKNFGAIDIKRLMSTPMPGRYAVRNKLPSTHRDLNQAVEEAAGAAHFVNVSALLCGPQGLCPLFLPDGRLISYDGGHLTKDGARLLGKLLSEHLRGRQFVLQNHRSVSSAALVQSAGAQR